MIEHRLAALQKRMEQAGVDLCVFGSGPSCQYLTGRDNRWRFRADMIPAWDLLLVPAPSRDGVPALLSADAPMDEQLREACRDVGGGTIAVGDRPRPSAWQALIDSCPGASFVAADFLTEPLRLIKDAGEISLLRKAAALTDEAVRAALPIIREGISMKDLQLEIEMHGRRHGAAGTSFDIVAGFIQPGAGPTGSIFSYDADEALRSGTTIFFDIGFVVDGYCSDWGRTIYFGTPDADQRAAYASLQRAVTGTIESIEVGRTRVCDLYPMIEKRLDGDGYGDYLRARLRTRSVGHQIGIEVHELPWLEPHNDDTIVPGMVFCTEPKLWDDGTFYMRVEDMILVTDDGAEALSKFDRDLFEL